jgi:hypothetical protein
MNWSRLQKLEQRFRGSRPGPRDEIMEAERMWVRLWLKQLIANRAHERGTCVIERYHSEVDHRPPQRDFEWRSMEWLVSAYDAGKPEPGWQPRVIEEGYYGAPDLDPRKVDAALIAWLKRYGHGVIPRDWDAVLLADKYNKPLPAMKWNGVMPRNYGRTQADYR